MLIFIARPRAEDRVMIHVASHDEPPLSYANELRKIVRDEMNDPELIVNVGRGPRLLAQRQRFSEKRISLTELRIIHTEYMKAE